jgi:hypothetical protein
MKRIVHLMCLVMGLLLASCGQRPVSGYVVGKKHVPERNVIHYNPVLHMNQVQHIREQWVVFVADSLCVTPCHVKPDTYERIKKGDFVTAKGFE